MQRSISPKPKRLQLDLGHQNTKAPGEISCPAAPNKPKLEELVWGLAVMLGSALFFSPLHFPAANLST